MKQLLRAIAVPGIILLALLTLTLIGSAKITRDTNRWCTQLQRSERLAQSGLWQESAAALERSYADWEQAQTYLHITAHHSVVDDADAMYRRAMAFTVTQELSEFLAETADLKDQLRLLAETEQPRLRNILCVTFQPAAYSARS